MRLQYLRTVFSESNQNGSLQFKDQQFLQVLHEVFTDEILESMMSDSKSELDVKNLVNRLYIIWKKSQIKMGIKQKKNLQKKLTQSLNSLLNTKNKKKLQKSLQEEQKYLNLLLSSDMINGKKKQSQNQIQNQIQTLENQLDQINQTNSKTLQNIQSFLQNQQNSFIKLDENIVKQNLSRSKKTQKLNRYKRSQIQTVSEQYHTTIELDEIQFVIKNLEERQLAESMAKILESKKINGDNFYLVSFEQALHVEPKLFDQKQFIKLNKLRQTSMFQFYRTGVKSLYSYTCQSYAGFGEIAYNRQNLGKYKPKDVFEMMKKTPNLTSQALATFNKFYTCHHCKFLYPDYLLKTCKFSSDRQALPKNNFQATLDPDFSQILCTPGHLQNKGRVSQRFTTRKKNCLTGYAKISEQYICGRKYCISCLKDCYPNQIMNESIFCPFCQGNCQCSRCLRNQKIVKFKNAYSILGGDLFRLSLQSCIQKLQNKQQSMLPKRRGRPKKFTKKVQHIAINKVQKKMKGLNNIDLKLDGLNGQRRITLTTNKKDKANKKRLILRQKSSTSLLPRRKRGRPPKSSCQSVKESIKLFKNQADQKQIESIFQSMNK